MHAWVRFSFLFAGLLAAGCGRHTTSSSLKATWVVLAPGDSDNALTRRCQDLGVENISLQAESYGPFAYACNAFAAETSQIPSGTYTISAAAFGANDKVLTTLEFKDVVVYGVTDLGELRFKIP